MTLFDFFKRRLYRQEEATLIGLENVRAIRTEANDRLIAMAASLGKDEAWFRVRSELQEGAPVCGFTEQKANHST